MAASTFGIEEEYFLTDLASRCVAQRGVEAFAISSRRALGQRVTREMFAAQFEVVTPVLNSLDEARDCLGQARKTMADLASEFGCGILAAGTHPLEQWRSVQATNMARYRAIFDDYRIVASRSVLAGLHVHVGVPEGVDRIRLMNRLTPWLPLLLGLSASSPFWDGRPCGLMSYRQAVCDEWPRMGIPDHFRDDAEYQRYLKVMTDTDCIGSAVNLWWNIRPSLRFPTLELRIADLLLDGPTDAFQIAQLIVEIRCRQLKMKFLHQRPECKHFLRQPRLGLLNVFCGGIDTSQAQGKLFPAQRAQIQAGFRKNLDSQIGFRQCLTCQIDAGPPLLRSNPARGLGMDLAAFNQETTLAANAVAAAAGIQMDMGGKGRGQKVRPPIHNDLLVIRQKCNDALSENGILTFSELMH